MAEIPEHLLRRSAEAKAKALGVPVEQVLAEMKGEAPVASVPAADVPTADVPTADVPTADAPDPTPADPAPAPHLEPEAAPVPVAEAQAPEAAPVATAIAVEDVPEPAAPATETSSNGGATSVSPRPVAHPEEVPDGVRPQRLLTVVKARAIQQVKSTPTDKVNTWPHLMIAEFTALLLMTAVLIVMSVILQAPLLELANFNATPNPSKAPWYFLGLQELLSYYDPQVAGVLIPGVTGLVGFMAVPYIDRNPSTKPSDRKFVIMLYTFFLAGSATLTLIGTLFRGPGFNFTYPWADGIWFDDLSDWVKFE
jgi:menaquinol-cytochrome c reductase cytochrome b/c subunit